MAKLEQKKSIPHTETESEVRPPVVAILGHIDHGKSTLIDYIRKTNITSGESGGITQHISAYEIIHQSADGRTVPMTFLDTPGHEAFSSLRTRCTNVADLAALIVSAEDGVKPQTLEVLKCIKNSDIPYIVVITKIDKPSADLLRTKQNLAENEIYVEGYGGDTPVVALSAKTGEGVSEFLDMISLMSELENKKADRETLGSGIIIESKRDAKRGILAVGIIKDGTMRPGLFASTHGAIASIRFLLDAEGNMVDELSFSSPVQIIGWDTMPTIGEEFHTFLKKEEALVYATSNVTSTTVETNTHSNLDKDVTHLSIVLKGDTAGSLEAVTSEIKKLAKERIVPKIILSSVGSINENDVKSALAATGAVIIGFNTKVEPRVSLLAERSHIKILTFGIIYELTNKIKELLSENEPRIEIEEIVGHAKVLKLFGITKGKQIIGGHVTTGLIKRGATVKIIRRESEIGKGQLKELQQSKIATDTVSEGTDFGAMIESKMEIAPGDVLKAVILVTK